MNHYINTAAVEPTRARTPSLNSTTPQPFPVLFFGDTRSHSFFFHSDGTIEDWSGDATYTLRVTIGDAQAGPFGGTYTVTCGSTSAALPYNTTAVELQDALNALTTIVSQGPVTVTGSFPTFLVTANAVGARTNITANAALLTPNSAITIEVLTTGTASVRQEWRISIRRNVISSDDTWTVIATPYDGWTGFLTTNTEGAFALLVNEGTLVGGLLQAQTLITIEVTDPSGNVVSYFQMPVTLRGKPGDLAATQATPMASYQPLNAKLSSISALANSAGVLTNDGAGVLSWGASGSGSWPLYSSSRVIWVNKGGNDTTGDGTAQKPYLTMAKAITAINAAGNISEANPYMIELGGGSFADSVTIPAHVYIRGAGPTSTILGVLQFTPDATSHIYNGFFNVRFDGNIFITDATHRQLTMDCCGFGNVLVRDTGAVTPAARLYNCYTHSTQQATLIGTFDVFGFKGRMKIGDTSGGYTQQITVNFFGGITTELIVQEPATGAGNNTTVRAYGSRLVGLSLAGNATNFFTDRASAYEGITIASGAPVVTYFDA